MRFQKQSGGTDARREPRASGFRRADYLRLRETASLMAQRMTATAAAARLGLTKASVYAHLRRLDLLGYRIDAQPIREGERGPLAMAYQVSDPVGLTQ